jgi:uracil-DNA glycosylase family 4
MSNKESAGDVVRQARQLVESLKAAGVDWLPKAKLRASAPVPLASVPSASEAQPDADIQGRKQELETLRACVAQCMRCTELASTRTQTVFGVGKMDPELCFIGEAPGADEDAQGEPFVGAAGQLLNKIIVACKMTREEVYICNILRCRPPGNRTPLPNEAGNCREYLEKQIALVRPKYICCLGACAAQNLLQSSLSIGRMRGQFHSYKGIPVLCTYHPSYLLRNPSSKKDVWEDMKKLMAQMGRPIE